MSRIDMVPSTSGSTADVHAPAGATAAVLTYAAVTGKRHIISQVIWSYDTAPTGGALTIQDVSGTTIFSINISAAGPGFITFDPPICGAANNTAMIVTLASGAGAVVGKVNARHWVE